MGTFSIWHWAIVLLLIGVPVFFAVRSAAKPSQNPESLVGFGGWLMLLAIGQTLSPLRTLADFGNSADGYQQLMTSQTALWLCMARLPSIWHFWRFSWWCWFQCCGEAVDSRNCFSANGLRFLLCLSWIRSGFRQSWAFR